MENSLEIGGRKSEGYSPEWFVDNVDRALCGLCKLVLNDPWQCKNSHMFCRICIEDSLQTLKKCPFCTQKLECLDDLGMCIFVKDYINSLKVRCNCLLEVESGCTWTGTLEERKNRDCEYLYGYCSNLGCEQKILLNNLEHHIMTECGKRVISCDFCQAEMTADVLAGHKTQCDGRPVICECGKQMTFKEIDSHQDTDCPVVIIPCPVYQNLDACVTGCQGRVARWEMQSHLGQESELLLIAAHKVHTLNEELCQLVSPQKSVRSGMNGISSPMPPLGHKEQPIRQFAENTTTASNGANTPGELTPRSAAAAGFGLSMNVMKLAAEAAKSELIANGSAANLRDPATQNSYEASHTSTVSNAEKVATSNLPPPPVYATAASQLFASNDTDKSPQRQVTGADSQGISITTSKSPLFSSPAAAVSANQTPFADVSPLTPGSAVRFHHRAGDNPDSDDDLDLQNVYTVHGDADVMSNYHTSPIKRVVPNVMFTPVTPVLSAPSTGTSKIGNNFLDAVNADDDAADTRSVTSNGSQKSGTSNTPGSATRGKPSRRQSNYGTAVQQRTEWLGVYEGEIVNNFKHGFGKFTFTREGHKNNGDVYEGMFANNRFKGKGTMRYANGDVYEGKWENNERKGEGKLTYADGSKYEGLWFGDMQNGKGKFVDTEGTVHTGKWVMGKVSLIM